MHYAIKAYGGVLVQIHAFFTSALIGGEWSAPCPCHFTPWEKAPVNYWKAGSEGVIFTDPVSELYGQTFCTRARVFLYTCMCTYI
jgi:hypothetical protein